MTLFEKGLQNLPAFRQLAADVTAGRLPAAVTGVSLVHKALLLHGLQAATGRRLVILAGEEAEAHRLVEDLRAFGQRVVLLPARDLSLRQVESVSREYEQQRLGALASFLNGGADCIVATADAAMQYTLSPDVLLDHTLDIMADRPLPVENLAETLTAAGYERCTQVESAGQFAVRGGIVDIYPADAGAPLRLELWGDTVDTLSYFDPATQRRTDPLDGVSIPPAAEILCDFPAELAEKIRTLAASLKGKSAEAKTALLADADRLMTGGAPASLDKYIPLLYDTTATLFDYAEDALPVVLEPAKVKERARTYLWQLEEDITALLAEGQLCRGLTEYAMDWDTLSRRLAEGCVTMDAFARSSEWPMKGLYNLT
ncbi:MAG: transcription-repair coupling factor, partial [Clostridia bacterium]|nr:transcription-repair coupling factor [Clostridia bacterium]